MIPVDICIKGMIIAAFKVWKDREEIQDIPVYNAASIKRITYASILEKADFVMQHPSQKAVSTPIVIFTECTVYAWILRIFLNILPALIVDGFLCLTKNKPK